MQIANTSFTVNNVILSPCALETTVLLIKQSNFSSFAKIVIKLIDQHVIEFDNFKLYLSGKSRYWQYHMINN